MARTSTGSCAPAPEGKAQILAQDIEKRDPARAARLFLDRAHSTEAALRGDLRCGRGVPGMGLMHRLGLEMEANLVVELLLVRVASEERTQAMPESIDQRHGALRPGASRD